MGKLPGRLGSLLARDVMTRDVITLDASDSIENAVAKLKKNRITGAPVVNDDGKFVGILSLSDLVRHRFSIAERPGAKIVPLADGDDETTWELFEKAVSLEEETRVERVDERMSKKVTSVTDAAPIVEAARVMCRGHWHRVPVVESNGALCGIISTMDILAALVNTADEAG